MLAIARKRVEIRRAGDRADRGVGRGERRLAAEGLGRFRNARFALYLAGGFVAIAILALLSVLAATGHLWVHVA